VFFRLEIALSSAFFMHNARDSRILSPQTERICLVFQPLGVPAPPAAPGYAYEWTVLEDTMKDKRSDSKLWLREEEDGSGQNLLETPHKGMVNRCCQPSTTMSTKFTNERSETPCFHAADTFHNTADLNYRDISIVCYINLAAAGVIVASQSCTVPKLCLPTQPPLN